LRLLRQNIKIEADIQRIPSKRKCNQREREREIFKEMHFYSAEERAGKKPPRG
jgi:hypothetical protein